MEQQHLRTGPGGWQLVEAGRRLQPAPVQPARLAGERRLDADGADGQGEVGQTQVAASTGGGGRAWSIGTAVTFDSGYTYCLLLLTLAHLLLGLGSRNF